MSEAFGTWQLESLIAVGGLGEVWRATRGDTTAAVKRLHTHLVRNDEARELFAQEQQLALALPRHPNVVHAIDVGNVEGRPYVALELAAGEDLRRIVAPSATPANTKPAACVTRLARSSPGERSQTGEIADSDTEGVMAIHFTQPGVGGQ